MSIPFNPLQAQGYDLGNKAQSRKFVQDLANLLASVLTPSGLASILATAGVLQPSSMFSAANTLIGNNTGSQANDAGLTIAQVAAMFNGQNQLAATSLQNSLTDLGSPAGNSTIDTTSSAVIAVRVAWTTAANWTLTLNNVAQGAIILLRLANNSGAARTFTVLANSPSSVAYTVNLFTPTALVLSSGVSVNSAARLNGIGVAYTVAAAPAIDLEGSNG